MLRDHRDHATKPSLREPPSHLHDRGMEAPAIADRQHDAGFARGRDRPIGAGALERDRFFDMDVLARGGGRDNL